MFHLDNAESMSCRSFHHQPALHERDFLRAECLQSRRFRVEVVSFDVQVYSRRMLHFLHFDLQVCWRSAELDVGGVALLVRLAGRIAECATPERGRGIDIAGLAVDDETGEAAAVRHVVSPSDHSANERVSMRAATR